MLILGYCTDKLLAFPSVIRALSERVEREHAQHLRDAQRIEDRSALPIGGTGPSSVSKGPVDFETLVSGGAARSSNGPSKSSPQSHSFGKESGDDDIWGSILNSDVSNRPSFYSPTLISTINSSPHPNYRQTPCRSWCSPWLRHLSQRRSRLPYNPNPCRPARGSHQWEQQAQENWVPGLLERPSLHPHS